MTLSSRSRMSVLISAVTFVAIIGAIVLTAVPRGTAIHAAGPSTRSGSGTATETTPLSVKNFTPTPGPGPTQPLIQSTHVYVNRLGRNGIVPSLPASSVPSGPGVPLTNLPADASLQNFNGVSSADNAAVNGFDLEPPDQGLCVGPAGFVGGQEAVAEPINLAIRFFSTSGTSLIGPLPLSFLFAEPTAEFISDPRCVFDPATGDFFFSILAIDPSNTASHQDITVLNQAGFLVVYRFDTTDASDVAGGCPCFGDQPKIGIDQNNIYVSVDEFSILGTNFNGSNVFAISKSQLAAFAASANFAEFLHLSDAGIPIEALQPAISTTNAPAEYLMHSFVVDVNGNNTAKDHRLGVFAITNGQVVSSGGIPTLLGPVVTQSEPYSQPQLAPSTGGADLNPDDDRLQQVQFTNGNLWAALSTAFSLAGALGINSCNQGVCDAAAWFQVAPVLIQGHLIAAEVLHQGYVAVPNTSLLYPAILQSPDGTVDMAFSVTSRTLNPSAGFATNVNLRDFFNQGQVFVAATGTGPDTGFTCALPLPQHCRWGDYSWATLDPHSSNIWMASEYIPPVASQSVFANWGTRVYEVAA